MRPASRSQPRRVRASTASARLRTFGLRHHSRLEQYASVRKPLRFAALAFRRVSFLCQRFGSVVVRHPAATGPCTYTSAYTSTSDVRRCLTTRNEARGKFMRSFRALPIHNDRRRNARTRNSASLSASQSVCPEIVIT